MLPLLALVESSSHASPDPPQGNSYLLITIKSQASHSSLLPQAIFVSSWKPTILSQELLIMWMIHLIFTLGTCMASSALISEQVWGERTTLSLQDDHTLCFLIEIFSSFIVNVITDKAGFMPAIFLFVFYVSYLFFCPSIFILPLSFVLNIF